MFKINVDWNFNEPPSCLPGQFHNPHRELDFCGVYRVTASGDVTLLTKAIERPNGIGFSPDEKTLYVTQSDPANANWTAFPVQADGTLGAGKEIHNATNRVNNKEPGLPDGLEVDAKGNVWASGPGGIFVFNPNGKLLGRIVTNERTSNCTIGDDGWLYITADSNLCRVKTTAMPIKFK